MTTSKRRRRTGTRLPRKAVSDIAYEHLTNRSVRERAAMKESSTKKDLMEHMESRGDIRLDQPVEYVSYSKGKPVRRSIGGFARQERTTSSLDEESTLALLKQKGLLDRCTTTITVVDEDAVLGANFDGDLTDDEIKGLYREKTTYALILVDADEDDEDGDDLVEQWESVL